MAGAASRQNGTKGGRPRGTAGIPFKSTVEKNLAREQLRILVLSEMEPILRAHIAHAKGIQHFYLRDPKTKQFVKIDDPKVIQTALNSGDEGSYYWIFTKDPSTQSLAYLLDQALDKAPMALEVSGKDGGPVEFRWKGE